MKRSMSMAALVGCTMLITIQTSVAGQLYIGQPPETIGPTVRCEMEIGAHTVFTVSDGLTYESTFVGHMVEFRSGQIVYPGSTYNVSLSTQILAAGGYVLNDLTPEAAYLYTQFRFGTLPGFSYSEDHDDYDQRVSESQLRHAIGYLQGIWTMWEIRYCISDVGLGWVADAEACGWTDVGDVRVMNITYPMRDGSFTDTKDYLCLAAGAQPPVTEPEFQLVDIDVKPGSDRNPINLKSKGVVPVAVFGADDFDVTLIDDPDSIILTDSTFDEPVGATPVRWSLGDIDGDGFEDIGLLFKTQELRPYLSTASAEVTLLGTTVDGVLFTGADAVDTFIKGKDKDKDKDNVSSPRKSHKGKGKKK